MVYDGAEACTQCLRMRFQRWEIKVGLDLALMHGSKGQVGGRRCTSYLQHTAFLSLRNASASTMVRWKSLLSHSEVLTRHN
ncbi:hypothetical protein ACSBR2_025087 [Camellia fascicularis]